MTERVYLVRKGHLGDVILTEPIAREFKAMGHTVALVTEYTHVEALLPTYNAVMPYSFLEDEELLASNSVHHLAYELHPHLHYVDGFAACAGVSVEDRRPVVRRGNKRIMHEPYCLLAPHTSSWCSNMRTWSHDKFRLLATQVERTFGLSTVLLEKSYTFMEMLSLIEHSALFIGNDSGPGVIAQAYGRPAFILFGATDHSKVLFSSRAHAVYADVGCNGCKQWHRNSLIECNSPQCLEQISVEHILAAIFRTGFPADVNAIHDCHV